MLRVLGRSLRISAGQTARLCLRKYCGPFAHRIGYWDQELKNQSPNPSLEPIQITLPNSSVKTGQAGLTTPLQIAQEISPGLARESVVANVDGILQDLNTPFNKDSSLALLKFDSIHGQQTFWHSSAHILGQAIEIFFQDKGGVHLSDGPSLVDHQSGGFFYDFLLPPGQTLVPEHLTAISEICNKIVKEKQEFSKLTISRSLAASMFSNNPIKIELLNSIPHSSPITIYRCGPFIDLCRGPHMQHTGMAKYFDLTTFSQVVSNLDGKPVQFHRVYGISFPDSKMYNEYKLKREEAEKRDHRVIGKQQQLFLFSNLSPGNVFFLPAGTRVYNTLVTFIKNQYQIRGYQEVITPNIFSNDLWKMSGHWDHYRDDMFFVSQGNGDDPASAPHQHGHNCSHSPDDEEDGHQFSMGLKPMNCPGHCLIFGSGLHSWRELPLRYADFSPLHRNESSGSLRGLTRLRRFVQDDAHIFCRKDQIHEVISECLEFVKTVYTALGFDYRVVLSTRPESFMGDLTLWENAEKALSQSLAGFGIPFTVNPGDGAFYGPKIDVMARDALGREHQCGTIQLDFQLPLRFGLSFMNHAQESEAPVIIHRAMFGSMERMMAILMEHNAGKWPFWLSPRQVIICSVSKESEDYVMEVYHKIKAADPNIWVEVNLDGDTIQKKIRSAQVAQWNYILVVGKKEKEERTVNVRTRAGEVLGGRSVDQILEEFQKLKKEYK